MIGADIRVRPASAPPQVAARKAAAARAARGGFSRERRGCTDARRARMRRIAGIDSHGRGIHPLNRLHALAFRRSQRLRAGARPHAPRGPA
jgi:hypothetical protein